MVFFGSSKSALAKVTLFQAEEENNGPIIATPKSEINSHPPIACDAFFSTVKGAAKNPSK